MPRPVRPRPAVARAGEFALSLLAVAVTTAAGRYLHANAATIGFVYLVVVVGSAMRLRNLAVALVTSLAATACYNYFFFPPVGTFSISEPANWVALATFLLASVLVTRLVARSERRAAEAELRRKQVEALYAERERLLAEQAHLESLRESDALKTSLLRAVSHDLRTPITSIRLGLEGLGKRIADEERRGDVRALRSEVERLSHRIDNLLSMARLEAGTLSAAPEPTPPADLFRAALDQLPLVLEGRTVEATVAPDAPDALADPTLAVEVLVNLLENAARAAPAERPIEIAAEQDGSGALRLEVRDRGPGLPATVKNAPPGEGGHGLGLEICRGLARAMGGQIALLDRAGGGTVARVVLPAARMEP